MILNDQQFQKLKQGFQTGAKSLGVMADSAFQGLRKTVSQMPISKALQGDIRGAGQQALTNFKNIGKDPIEMGLNAVTSGGAGIIKNVTKVGQEALKDSVYQGLKKLDFHFPSQELEKGVLQTEIMQKIEKGVANADDLRAGNELIELMKHSKPSSPLAQEVGKYKDSNVFVKDIHNRFGGNAQLLETDKLNLYETTIDRKLVDSIKQRIKSGDDSVFLHKDWKHKTPAIRIEDTPSGYKVVDGNHKLLAAKELGLKNVPVHILGYGDTTLPLQVSFKKGFADQFAKLKGELKGKK